MAEVVSNLKVKIGAETSQFKKSLGTAEKEVAGFKKKLTSQFAGLGAAAAAALSVGALINLGRKAAQAADVELKAETKLLTALKGRQEVTDNLIRQAGELQKKTLYGDEQTIDAMANLSAFVKNEQAISDLIPAIQDMATAMNMDLSQAATLVGKSIGSSTNALARYGVQITGAAGSNERAASAVEALTSKFKNQAEAAAKVGLGPWKQLQNVIGDAFEVIGKWIMPAIQRLAEALKKAFNPEKLEGLRSRMIDLANWFRELYNQSVLFRAQVNWIGVAFKTVWDAVELIFKNIFNQFQTFGKLVKAVLTGNFKEIPAILKEQTGKLKKIYTDFGKDVAGNFKNGFDRTFGKGSQIELIDKNKARKDGQVTGELFVEGLEAAGGDKNIKTAYEKLTGSIDELQKKMKAMAAQGKNVSWEQTQITALERHKQAIDDLVTASANYDDISRRISDLTRMQQQMAASGQNTSWIDTQINELKKQRDAVNGAINAQSALIRMFDSFNVEDWTARQETARDEIIRLEESLEGVTSKIMELRGSMGVIPETKMISGQMAALEQQRKSIAQSIAAQEKLILTQQNYSQVTTQIASLTDELANLSKAGKDTTGITAQIEALEKQKSAIDSVAQAKEQLVEIGREIAELNSIQKQLNAEGENTAWVQAQITALQEQKSAIENTAASQTKLVAAFDSFTTDAFIANQKTADQELVRLMESLDQVTKEIEIYKASQKGDVDTSAVTAQIEALEKQKKTIAELLAEQRKVMSGLDVYDLFAEKIRELTAEQKELANQGSDISWITAQIEALKKQQSQIITTAGSFRSLREEMDKAFDSALELRGQLIKPFTERAEREIITKTKTDKSQEPIETTQLMPMTLLTDDQVADYKTQLEEMKGATIDIGQEITSAFSEIAVGIAESLGQMMVGVGSFSDIGKIALSGIGDLAIQLGKIAIAAGLTVEGIKKALANLTGAPAIVAGVALVALGAAIKGAVSSLGKGGAGTYSQPSGTYDSRTFSQPLTSYNKQQTIQVEVTGETRIRNKDIWVAYKNAETNNRINT
jgi:hypothetical protein